MPYIEDCLVIKLGVEAVVRLNNEIYDRANFAYNQRISTSNTPQEGNLRKTACLTTPIKEAIYSGVTVDP